jgi:signal recognition particle subunit SRP54
MVLDNLGDTLRGALKKLKDAVFINDTVLNEIIKDIQRAMLQSDVNVKLVLSLTNNIKKRSKEEPVPPGLSKREQLINILYEELTKFLGGEFQPIAVKTKPFKIMLVGLFGNGKTTTAGKLAKYFAKRGFKVATVQTDTWRPAAYEQLKQVSAQAGVDFYGEMPDVKRKEDAKYPSEIFKKFEKEYAKYDIVIIDTAGRDALSDNLIDELNNTNKTVNANEILLVMGADVGQTAEKQAQAFHDTCKVSGVIITKMDGTAKGGGALTACAVTNSQVKFIGVGEKIDALEEFKPKNFVSRLLGMGDIESLLEKAKEAMNQEGAEDLQQRMMDGKFTLKDLYEQMNAMKKMGPLAKVVDLIPGMGGLNISKDMLKQQETKMESWKYIMDSCTKKEMDDPEIITSDRIARIAKGSGRPEADIRELLKQHKQSKKMLKMFKGSGGNDKNMAKMMKRMGGMKGLNMGGMQ